MVGCFKVSFELFLTFIPILLAPARFRYSTVFKFWFIVIALGQTSSVRGFVFFALDGLVPKLSGRVGGLAALCSSSCIRGVVSVQWVCWVCCIILVS